MKRCVRNWRIWALAGMLLTAAVLVPVFAARQQGDLTATPYADVIRFEAGGVVTSLQITIFDLSSRELWDSGVIPGRIIDWGRTNEWGERLAYGTYLYKAAGWDVQGNTVLERSGKLALLPGDKVELQAAPAVSDLAAQDKASTVSEPSSTVQPMGLGDTGIFGKVGVGASAPDNLLHVYAGKAGNVAGHGYTEVVIEDDHHSGLNILSPSNRAGVIYFGDPNDNRVGRITYLHSTDKLYFMTNGSSYAMAFDAAGRVGIGTLNPQAKLHVDGGNGFRVSSSTATNLIEAYNDGDTASRVFAVDADGDVYADGTYYCSDGAVHVGSADVAERINVSEWVEPSYVVEIDPEHPGFFRKTRSPYSNKVAGVISTSPGVVLGNSFDAEEDKWEDNRPVLAIAGRVPVKTTAENGPVQIGDLLVSSSTPGVAMKGTEQNACIGAVVGKAMESLDEGSGVIMVQVMLR